MSNYDQDMPTQYTTQTTHAGEVIDKEFVRSWDGILKVVETVLSLITFICATVDETFVKHWGGGWVQFVSITAFLINIIVYMMYLFYIVAKLPDNIPKTFVEFIYYAAFTVLYFTAGIVAAVKGNWHSAIAAAAFFCFACLAAFGCDAVLKFVRWRQVTPQITNTTTTTTTSGSSTTTGTAQMPPGVYPAEQQQPPSTYTISDQPQY